jgi:hypothetical protein
MPVCAGTFMWQTNFVILSVRGSLTLAAVAQEAFSIVEAEQPRLSQPDGSGQITMTIDADFMAAADTGPAAIHELLKRVEERHFRKLEKAIVKSKEDQGGA